MMTRPAKRMTGLVAGMACIGLANLATAAPVSPTAAPGFQPGGHAVIPASEKASIGLPESVDRGQAVSVTISGGGPVGMLEVWGPTGTAIAGRTVSETPVVNGVAALNAPADAGSYEVRYYDSSGRLSARSELEVAASPVQLSIPDPVGAGYNAAIDWTGPADPGDTIQFVDPANGTVVAETPALGQPGALNRSILRAPEQAGQYVLRYWSSRARMALSELPLPVGDGVAWLRVPTEVVAGSQFLAEWMGPGDPAYAYQVIEPTSGSVLNSSAAQLGADGAGLPARLTAPEKPGSYRVRFVNMATGFVLADLPLDVDAK